MAVLMLHVFSYHTGYNIVHLEADIKKRALPLADATFVDLIDSSNGVYVFLYGNEIIYVGKCSSRSFSERLAAHVSNSPHGYMNNVMQNIAWSFARPTISKKDFHDDSNEPERTDCFNKAIGVMKEFKIAFITFGVAYTPIVKAKIENLEKDLIKHWNPVLNRNPRQTKNNLKYKACPWISVSRP